MRPYIITKRHFDEIGHYYANMHDISFVNMRLEHVYGPGMVKINLFHTLSTA